MTMLLGTTRDVRSDWQPGNFACLDYRSYINERLTKDYKKINFLLRRQGMGVHARC